MAPAICECKLTSTIAASLFTLPNCSIAPNQMRYEGVVTLAADGCNIGRWRCDSEGGRRIFGEARENTPGFKARSQLFAVKRWAQQMTLERKVLADRTKAREEGLRALWLAKTSHASLAFPSLLISMES